MKPGEQEYIDATLTIIRQTLSDEPERMVSQIKEAEARVGYCYFILSQLNAELDRAESVAADNFSRAEKLSAYVLEDKVNAAVSENRAQRDIVQGLIKSLEGRTMVGLGILRYLRSLPGA